MEQDFCVTKILSFVDRLAGTGLPDCFNPYCDKCEVFDRENAPSIRTKNLLTIFDALKDKPSVDLWVGRDLGYRGGRRTGLALTDEYSLDLYAMHLGLPQLQRATSGPPVKERTAANIFEILSVLARPILTWNVFPFHPHRSDNVFSNRQHSASEAKLGFSFLQELVEIFPVNRIVAIGNDAARWTTQLRGEHLQVRHPSYGGQTEFQTKMRRVYGIGVPLERQPTLF